MTRFAAPSALQILLLVVASASAAPPQRAQQQAAAGQPQTASALQPGKPCAYLSKADAESILGRRVVSHADNEHECWFWQEGFAGGNTADNKQVHLSIWRSMSLQANAIDAVRADWARQQVSARNLTGFGDAALWGWTPGVGGTLEAFKGGTLRVEVTISGLPEDATLQNAKTLAAKVLGGAGGTGYDYAKASAAQAAQERAAAAIVHSPASYQDAWLGQEMTFRGTVSKVDIDFKRFPQWLTIFFRESPDNAFVACSPYPDMIQDSLGQLSALVGKTLQISGTVEPAMCRDGKGGSIKLLDPKQYRLEGGATRGHIVAAGGAPVEHKGGARVGLDICNAGDAAFDAIVARQGRASATHLAPRDCAHVYEGAGGAAYVGFAFNDAQGRWEPARRIDLLPNTFGSQNAPTRVWSKAAQSFPVKHGGREVSMPVQLAFSPPPAVCTTSEPYSAVANLPFNASAAERNAAYAQDANSPGPVTTCGSYDYALNAVAYPDTREVTFERKCDGCPVGNPAAMTPEQRAGLQQTTQTMSKISPLAGGIMAQLGQRQQEAELAQSLEGQKDVRRMNWDEMNQALAHVRRSGRPPEMPAYLIIRGTVSRVDVSAGEEHWVNIYFRESPDGAFDVCTSNHDILTGLFGPEFRTRMVGQVVEVEGEYQRNYCKGARGSIRITLAHDLRKVGKQ